MGLIKSILQFLKIDRDEPVEITKYKAVKRGEDSTYYSVYFLYGKSWRKVPNRYTLDYFNDSGYNYHKDYDKFKIPEYSSYRVYDKKEFNKFKKKYPDIDLLIREWTIDYYRRNLKTETIY